MLQHGYALCSHGRPFDTYVYSTSMKHLAYYSYNPKTPGTMVSKNGVTFGQLLSGGFCKLRKSPLAPAGGFKQPRMTLGAPGASAPLARRAFDFIWCSTRSLGLRAHSCGRQLTRGMLILAPQLARGAARALGRDARDGEGTA